jgi:type IX secretion system substrate protein
MKKIITSLAIAITINCSAQTFVTIPDANFVTYLQGLIPSAMSGNQLNTSSTLVTTTTHTINVNSLSIANLSGVQYFSSLTYLDCGSNLLTSLPTLPNTLTYLACANNSLTSLPALPNSIAYIDCSSNSISALPTLPTALTNIFCNSNALTTLPALPNSLMYLDCSSNHITSIPALPNTLVQLECTGNNLTTFPALPNSLNVLYCANNNLTTLPALPNSLQQLYCNNNNIGCFPVFPNSIALLNIDPNPYTCLPNYIAAMDADTVTYPICSAGNTNGCPYTAISCSITITYTPATCSTCCDGIASVATTDTCTPHSYSWDGGGFLANSTENNLCAGTHTVVVGDNGGAGCCGTMTSTITIPNGASGIQQFSMNDLGFTIYPNPANTSFTLTLSKGEGIYNVSICDMLGNTVKQFTIHNSLSTIDVSDVNTGVYFITLTNGTGVSTTKKVVVNK